MKINLYPENVITPLYNGERIKMPVSTEDYAKVAALPRVLGTSVTVRDTRDGREYRITQAPCSFPTCYCDAIATEVSS